MSKVQFKAWFKKASDNGKKPFVAITKWNNVKFKAQKSNRDAMKRVIQFAEKYGFKYNGRRSTNDPTYWSWIEEEHLEAWSYLDDLVQAAGYDYEMTQYTKENPRVFYIGFYK